MKLPLAVFVLCLVRVNYWSLGAKLDVEISLERATVFVGEAPSVLIKCSAPADEPVTMVKPDKFVEGAALGFRLVAPDGTTIRDYYKSPIGVDLPKLLTTLPAGRSLSARCFTATAPAMPGVHTLKISFQPTGDGEVVMRELKLTVEQLDELQVVSKLKADLPLQPSWNRPKLAGSTIEVLNVRTTAGTFLYYRLWSHDVVGGANGVLITRLWPTADDAELQQLAISCSSSFVQTQMWVTFRQGGEQHLGRLVLVSGNAIDLKLLSIE